MRNLARVSACGATPSVAIKCWVHKTRLSIATHSSVRTHLDILRWPKRTLPPRPSVATGRRGFEWAALRPPRLEMGRRGLEWAAAAKKWAALVIPHLLNYGGREGSADAAGRSRPRGLAANGRAAFTFA